MPRSGPRPFECVRRAWHSERHQPMRGSLIKEIFRVVNEIHSSATKKNKEWQEKLPIVVLKAEEIMYSKANSEAEYMDLKTLWDRTNDAINTIIRRDEGTENGEFLQPCIEAALNLGCIPRRASRSQRNTNPRCYLIPVPSDVPSVSHSVVKSASQRDFTSSSQYGPHCSNFLKPQTINSTPLDFESRFPAVQNNDCTTMKFLGASENVPHPDYDQSFPRKNQAASNFCSYPLHYGNFPQFEELKHGFVSLPKSVSNPSEPAKMSVIPIPFRNEDKSTNSTQPDRDYSENPCTIGCDLSLRLGPLSSQYLGGENSQPHEGKDVGVQEGTKCTRQSPQFDKRFSFIPKANEYGPRDSYLSKLSFEGEYTNVQATMRKRKAALNHLTEDTKFCRQPELPFSHLPGNMGNGGL